VVPKPDVTEPNVGGLTGVGDVPSSASLRIELKSDRSGVVPCAPAECAPKPTIKAMANCPNVRGRALRCTFLQVGNMDIGYTSHNRGNVNTVSAESTRGAVMPVRNLELC
jgi:hypothetical protein